MRACRRMIVIMDTDDNRLSQEKASKFIREVRVNGENDRTNGPGELEKLLQLRF